MKTVITTIIAIVTVLGLTTLGVHLLKANAPQAEKKKRIESAPVVEVEVVSKDELEFSLESEGVVGARRETILSPQVGGRLAVVDDNFEVGATYKKGQIIAEIDSIDYKAAVAQAESTLADAELALIQEEARAEQAARDWEKIGGDKPASDLVLRVPFLISAKARVTAAIASRDKAKADLARTKIVAPFDCRVRSVNMNLGATIVPGAQLGTIYDPNNLMIRLPFSLDDYAQLPDKTDITLFTDIGGKVYEWKAEMMWELGQVDQKTLSSFVLAKIIANNDHPNRFHLPSPGMFLNATVKGGVLPGVIAVPRSAVRGRNQILVLNGENKLELRELMVARKNADYVFATQGVADGEMVILTKVDMPIPGMILEPAKVDQQEEGKNESK